MIELLKQAKAFAFAEHLNMRATLILVPDRQWQSASLRLGTPPRNVFIRHSLDHPGLLSVAVDTLITLGALDPKGLRLGQQRLACSTSPRWIHIDEKITEKELV